MRKSISLALFVISFGMTVRAGDSNPDKFIETKTFQGQFVGTSQQDYAYLDFQDMNGKEESFSLSNLQEACFLDSVKNETISITYDVIQRYIPEGAGYYPIQIIKSMGTKSTDYQSWLNSKNKPDWKKCEELFDKNLKKEPNVQE